MSYTLFNADCLSLTDLPKVHAVVSDPPYGSANRCDYTRFTTGNKGAGFAKAKNKTWAPVIGDDQPFDPSPWLKYPKVALWGYQHFANKLPPGAVLVWVKKRDSQLGYFTSDAELCWTNHGLGCWVHQHTWYGLDREGERGPSLHPTQKSVEVMKWVMGRLGLKPGQTVYDPYMGSGTTGVAAAELGLHFVGAELVKDYYDVAESRIAAAYNSCAAPAA